MWIWFIPLQIKMTSYWHRPQTYPVAYNITFSIVQDIDVRPNESSTQCFFWAELAHNWDYIQCGVVTTRWSAYSRDHTTRPIEPDMGWFCAQSVTWILSLSLQDCMIYGVRSKPSNSWSCQLTGRRYQPVLFRDPYVQNFGRISSLIYTLLAYGGIYWCLI